MSWAALVEAYGGVAISVGVLLAVELAARHGSSHLAAIAATVPTGIPLSLLILTSKQHGSQEELQHFAAACLQGSVSLVCFCLAMFMVARRGGGFGSMLCAGYAMWLTSWWLIRSALAGLAQTTFQGSSSPSDGHAHSS
mmetsp:Transcript_75059/g.140032  ORF Transcript_75059/g.140032 Transcript_75059/m.140032 type:complete len:139 (+) Transcript_75059:49-465(+)